MTSTLSWNPLLASMYSPSSGVTYWIRHHLTLHQTLVLLTLHHLLTDSSPVTLTCYALLTCWFFHRTLWNVVRSRATCVRAPSLGWKRVRSTSSAWGRWTRPEWESLQIPPCHTPPAPASVSFPSICSRLDCALGWGTVCLEINDRVFI